MLALKRNIRRNAVKESRERIKAALKDCGFCVPLRAERDDQSGAGGYSQGRFGI
jgi:hypothetical protein